MGDSACVMHAFSYASPIPNEAQQGNPMHALGESVSFGRFTTESLSWEKWSTFSHKRYVEEAASYAQPGSVAQKKAFFEAHYKRIAARKAAALLEQQANAANNITEDPEVDNVNDSRNTILSTDVAAHEQECKANSPVHNDENTSIAEPTQPETYIEKKANLVTENETPYGSRKPLDNVEEEKEATESELSGTSQMEKPLLKKSKSCNQEVSSATSKRRPAISSTNSSAYHKKPLKVPSPPARPKTPGYVKKVKNVTPITKKPISDSMNEKRSPPKSLRSLINYPSTHESDKSPVPPTQKPESSKVAPTSLKALKDCSTPLRTPVPATPKGASKLPPVTPRSEKKRTNMSVDPSVSGSKTTGPKWHILSAVSKSLTACRNKLQSPTISTPFLLRTEERAARRKQKLEDKFNAKDAEKVQVHRKFKEKAETELRKLRQSFCFKARPLPDFYKQKETTKVQIHQTQATCLQSPKLARKASARKLQGISSLPPPISRNKKDGGSENRSKKEGQFAIKFHASKPDTITAHENRSPNIQS